MEPKGEESKQDNMISLPAEEAKITVELGNLQDDKQDDSDSFNEDDEDESGGDNQDQD